MIDARNLDFLSFVQGCNSINFTVTHCIRVNKKDYSINVVIFIDEDDEIVSVFLFQLKTEANKLDRIKPDIKILFNTKNVIILKLLPFQK